MDWIYKTTHMKRLALLCACTAALLLAVACGEERQKSAAEITAACPDATSWVLASEYVGEEITVYGHVVDAEFVQRGIEQPTYLYVGKPPTESGGIRILIRKPNLLNFPFAPEAEYKGKTLCITGTIEVADDGELQIQLRSPSEVIVV